MRALHLCARSDEPPRSRPMCSPHTRSNHVAALSCVTTQARVPRPPRMHYKSHVFRRGTSTLSVGQVSTVGSPRQRGGTVSCYLVVPHFEKGIVISFRMKTSSRRRYLDLNECNSCTPLLVAAPSEPLVRLSLNEGHTCTSLTPF